MPISGANNPKNLTRVMATGVFDLLHPGHVYYLEESKKLGDELVVIVANDQVVAKTKGQPLFGARERQRLVGALSCVDKVMIPKETDATCYYKTVLDARPDIITLGYDQQFSESDLAAELAKHGWHGKIVRIEQYPSGPISSSMLKKKLSKKIEKKKGLPCHYLPFTRRLSPK